MSSELFHLFLLGLTLTISLCSIFCSPLLFPFLLSATPDRRKNFLNTVLFILVRLFTFIFLVLGSYILGREILILLGKQKFFFYAIAAIFISGVGVSVFLKKELFFFPFRLSGILLGFLMAVLPCAPRVATIAYIGLKAKSAVEAGTMALAFAGSEALVTFLPLFIFNKFLQNRIGDKKFFSIFRKIGGILLILLGLRLMLFP